MEPAGVMANSSGNPVHNLTQYRLTHEPEEHWQLKREFLMAHINNFEEDRLLCLAQAYVNTQLLGCRYPRPVMEEIKALSEGLGTQYKDYRQNKLQRTFVAASDAARSKVCRLPLSIPKKANEPPPPAPKKHKMIVAPPTEDNSGQNASNNPGKRNKISASSMEGSSTSSFSGVQDTMQPKNNRFFCSADSKQPSKNKNNFDGRIDQQRITAYLRHMNNKRNPFCLLVLRRFTEGDGSSSNILMQSCQQCKVDCNYDYTPDLQCTVTVKGNEVATVGIADAQFLSKTGKNELKEAASHAALQKLSKSCYLIEVVKTRSVEQFPDAVQLDDILRTDARYNRKKAHKEALNTGFSTPMAQTSLGSKLLQKMGWTGGGLGKTGTGIEEPIRPYLEGSDRSGIGFGDTPKKEMAYECSSSNDNSRNVAPTRNTISDRDFRDAFRPVLRAFHTGEYQHQRPEQKNRIVFAAAFTKEQRALLHKLALSFRLSTKSYGVEPNRFLVVTRKLLPHETVLTALEGDDRYTVYEPGQYTI